MKIGVVVFPGSNCDHDCLHAINLIGLPTHGAVPLWHQQENLKDIDAIILPGGFSYGDYLRSGAIARFSPIMKEVQRFADQGGPVLGICNGFQILLEVGLLPGAMLANQSLTFICREVHLRLENIDTPFTRKGKKDQVIHLPIAHGDGNYFLSEDELSQLEKNEQVVFRYVNRDGKIDKENNPNGSCHHIAGICNERGNVLGMMPHPERRVEEILGGKDGRLLFDSLLGT